MDVLEARIAEKIRVEGDCWLWQGYTLGRGEYGGISVDGTYKYVHRVMYEILIGPIPDGLTLDHLCRQTLCANPFHCEPVTLRENILRGDSPTAVNARKSHCIHGHPLSGENLYTAPDGHRYCRTCRRRLRRESYWRNGT